MKLHRSMTSATIVLTLAIFVSPLAASDPPQPDYSREALLVMYGDFYAPEKGPSSLEWQFPIGRARIHVIFLPIVLPFVPVGRANPMPDVVPSEILNVSFASTKAMYALDDRNVAKAIRQIEKRRAREARFAN